MAEHAPKTSISRDPAMLIPLESVRMEPEPAVAAWPEETVALFRARAESLGIEVHDQLDAVPGERRLRATAAIASTGGVLITGDEATARRPLLSASRVVVEIDPATVVRWPSDVAPLLGEANALILTGASRTADIEKQIVRGIHGAEELVYVLAG